MNIEKALNRLNWRFKNENIKVGESKIIINELDLQAVDFLNDWIIRQKEIVFKKNVLFAKLFCYAFKNEILYYSNPKQSQTKICQELEKSIEDHYDSVLNTLNEVEYSIFLNDKGFPYKHPVLLTENEIIKRKELIKKFEQEIIILLKGKWTIDEVTKSLNNTITEILNRFSKDI